MQGRAQIIQHSGRLKKGKIRKRKSSQKGYAAQPTRQARGRRQVRLASPGSPEKRNNALNDTVLHPPPIPSTCSAHLWDTP